MKKHLWQILFTASFVWGSVVSVLYWQLKSNPRVIAITTDMAGADNSQAQSVQLTELEKSTFLRQYLERYFTYDSNNFWQSQTSLTFLMSPQLREKRIAEVQRLREKIQSKSLNQKGFLISLSQLEGDEFSALLNLQMNEAPGRVNSLYVTTKLRIESTERTLENPWGLMITKLEFPETSPTASAIPNTLAIRDRTPLTITFPCAIENILGEPASVIETKITTFNVSEIQLNSTQRLNETVKMTAYCKDKEYHFKVSAAEKSADVFRVFSADQAQVRKDPGAGKPRKKDKYDKTIENVLGIEVEN
ncbi:hypothetical protein ACLVWU_12890 [Bdellovibrio sp. HCB290]|uniref:hypothetical protein n=1 Tax=Bdellovibrio sp. HCB290 TaxID=3394356 RepID=UPI0039B50D35